MSFADSRAPGKTFFIFDQNKGMSVMKRSMGAIFVDEEKYADKSVMPEFKQVIESRQSFPANGFVLKLALRYDNNFASQFGANVQARYLADSLFFN